MPSLSTRRFAVLVLAGWLIAGCSQNRDGASLDMATGAPAAPPVEAGTPPSRGASDGAVSLLAYEHDVSIRLDAKVLPARMLAVRDACSSQKLGACTLLGEQQDAGDMPSGSLRMRVAPATVEPLVKLASHDAEIGQRNTRAEDLADAIADTQLRQRRLQSQHAKLLELLERKDIKVEDMIALTQQLSAIEAELQGANQEAAQQRRRIETNLLTLNFQSTGFEARSSAVREAFSNLGSVFDVSLAALITIMGSVLPFALFFAVLWWIIRLIRRRFRKS